MKHRKKQRVWLVSSHWIWGRIRFIPVADCSLYYLKDIPRMNNRSAVFHSFIRNIYAG
ncbi:MAG: hypothetical protein LKH78_04295 [Weizmannia coagulans]|nr:hypothetical protein B4100_1089 [Heyndrickxia coagulans]MCI1574927.1 hypothetical protein [Heyndrickxia coagulans]